MESSERGERMEGRAPGGIDRVAMRGGNVDLAEKRRLQINEAHALSHPQTGQADRYWGENGRTRSTSREAAMREFGARLN